VLNEFGFAQTPILWSTDSGTAYNDARVRIIAEGADPAEEIAKVQEIVEAELERIGAGSSAVSVPGSEAPATTG
jgi:multiple sugar transport system substrate-binding protein